jgi:hypothetical protein
MVKWMRQLDGILRGDATRMSALSTGRIEFPVQGILVASILLAAFYGACMSIFALLRLGGSADGWMQVIASTTKIPLLFFLTLVVTLPSLYVFNALVGSRISLLSVLNLMVASIAVMVTVLASLGPIIVFFSLSTTSHPFMVLLNVVAATVAGFLGMKFLFRTLNRLVLVRQTRDVLPATEVEPPPVLDPVPSETPAKLGAIEKGDEVDTADARSVFKTWVVVFALVGAQMSWVLRPFVGSPTLPFEWFREREGNFFMAVFEMLRTVSGG